jgi:hypothetical protein
MKFNYYFKKYIKYTQFETKDKRTLMNTNSDLDLNIIRRLDY